MLIVSAPDKLRNFLKQHYLKDQNVGFVPTMGALHDGHLELVKRCILENQISVVSIFVNPTQFHDAEDLANYPKDLKRDIKKLDSFNVDYVFTPSDNQLYPNKPLVSIDFGNLSKTMEGKFRKGHFKGVGMVLGKLFHIINPDRAYFGLKDLQQYLLIKRMCADLNFPVEIIGIDTVREPNGLAMSSRNRRLSKNGFETASALYNGLDLIKKGLKRGVVIEALLSEATHYYASINGLEIEYLEAINPGDLKTITSQKGLSELAVCVAGYVEGIRLIDNLYLQLK
ncbi:MAG: pantoate--beta-alanine ligase [Bacteroidota bacterium]